MALMITHLQFKVRIVSVEGGHDIGDSDFEALGGVHQSKPLQTLSPKPKTL